MSATDKLKLGSFSIRNPLARIFYASAPIASAVFIEIGKLATDPNTHQFLFSVLTTAGILAAPVAGIAGNFLAEAVSQKFFNRFNRKDILENGDLQKAVGDAICAVILAVYDEEQSIFKQNQKGLIQKFKGFFQKEIPLEAKDISLNKDVLKKLSKTPTSVWQDLVNALENDKDENFNLTIDEITELYPKNLPDIFAIPAAKFNEVTVLDKKVWEKILRKLCSLQGISTSNEENPHFTDTVAHIAGVLEQNFPELLKHTLITNVENDGKAYANLQLKIIGEILFYVRENNEKIDEANDKLFDIEAKISGLREFLEDGLDVNSKEFDKEFIEIRDLITSNQQIIVEAIGKLQITVNKIDETTQATLQNTEIIKENQERQNETGENLFSESQKHTELQERIAKAAEKLANNQQTEPQIKSLPKKISYAEFPAPTNYFTARKDVIENLKTTLDKHKKATLHGISGLGKTSVALEYAKRFEDEYKHIIFVRATKGDAESNFANLAGIVDESAKDLEKTADKAQKFKIWLEENAGWLLIIDNVDVPGEVLPLLPANPKGHILSTGNPHEITVLGNEVEIKKMKTENGELLLYRRAKTLSDLTDEEIKTELEKETEAERIAVKNIVEEFDGLPLALNLAGAYIHGFDKKFAEYERIYQTSAHKLLEKQDVNDQYQNYSVALAFSLAFDKIAAPENENSEAKQIAETAILFLKIAAFLSPDAMPLEIFIYFLASQDENSFELAKDELFLDEVYAKIAQFDLFEKDSDKQTFDIHRLVQKVVFNKIEPEEKSVICSQVLKILRGQMPLYDYNNKESCERFYKHTETTLENAEKLTLEIEDNMILYSQIGVYQYRLGNYPQAEKFYQKNLEISLSIFGKEQQETATCLNNLGEIYREQGRYSEAIEKFEEALLIDEKTIGKEHPFYATDLNNLALVYSSQGRYNEAAEKFEEALRIDEKTIGKEHLDYAIDLNNLGDVYLNQGKYDESIEKHEEALKIREKILGKKHPFYAQSLNNLAIVYHSQGRFEEAFEKYEEAKNITENSLGKEHPIYAIRLSNLGALYFEQGKYKEALQMYEEALQIFEAKLPENHPNIQMVKSRLENCRIILGKE